MRRLTFTLLLLCYVALLVALVFSVDTSQILQTESGQIQQALTWNLQPKIRSFLALQSLFGMLLFGVIGLALLFVLWPPARWIWLCGIGWAFLYYRLDPRYQDGESLYLLRGCLVLVFGALLERFVVSKLPTSFRFKGVIHFLLPVAFFPLAILAVRMATGIEYEQVFAIDARTQIIYALLYLSGFLSRAMLFGVARQLFASDEGSGLRLVSVRAARGSLKVTFGALLVTTFFAISAPVTLKLLWVLLSPFVSVFMAFYGPYTWFTKEVGAVIFSNDLLYGAGVSNSPSRVYLGILFQYLSAISLTLLWMVISRPRPLALVIAAHVLLILYWAPAIWLAYQIPSLH